MAHKINILTYPGINLGNYKCQRVITYGSQNKILTYPGNYKCQRVTKYGSQNRILTYPGFNPGN